MADSAEGTGSDGSPESAGSRGSTASGESGRPAVRVLLDTNVVLDWLLDGAPWANAAQPLWDARDAGRVVGHLPASVLTDIFYIARRQIGIPGANAAVDLYLDAFDVLPLDKSLLQQARTLPG